MNEDRYFIITHGDDLDGIIATGLLTGHLMGKNCETHLVSYPGQVAFFKNLSEDPKIAGAVIYVADLSCNEEIIIYLQIIAQKANRVVWIDHHDSTKDNIGILKKMRIEVVINSPEKVCASRLVIKFMNSLNPWHIWAGNVAQAHDYPISDGAETDKRIGEKLQKIISFYNWKKDKAALEKVVKKIATCLLWRADGSFDREMERVAEEYDIAKKEALNVMRQSKEIVTIGERKFLIALGDGLIYQKETMRDWRNATDEREADGFLVIFNINAVLFFKGRQNNFDAVPFCRFMGGGGREGDGGFSLNNNGLSMNLAIVKKTIIEKMREFFCGLI